MYSNCKLAYFSVPMPSTTTSGLPTVTLVSSGGVCWPEMFCCELLNAMPFCDTLLVTTVVRDMSVS